MEGFLNLSNHPNLEFFRSKDPEELKAQLAQINQPFQIVSVYFANGYHYIWVSLSLKVKKIKQEK